MSAEFWMGIAVGSVTPWVFVLLLIRRNKQCVDKAVGNADSATTLLAERNQIGRLQVAALNGILHRLEGIFDRMPEPVNEAEDFWSAVPEPKPEPSVNTSLIIVEDQPPFIGAPAFLGRQIKTLEDLLSAAKSKRSVVEYLPEKHRRTIPKSRPAVFALNQSGGNILNMIRTGLYIYIPATKTPRPITLKGKEGA